MLAVAASSDGSSISRQPPRLRSKTGGSRELTRTRLPYRLLLELLELLELLTSLRRVHSCPFAVDFLFIGRRNSSSPETIRSATSRWVNPLVSIRRSAA
jgi:hypothetical protein